MLEGPAHKPQTVKCPTMDPGASGDANESRSDISLKSANEGAVLEVPAHKP